MPLFEFVCPEHGKFEVLVRVVGTDVVTYPCPRCAVLSPKVISAFGAISWGRAGHWNKSGEKGEKNE